jgi:hypothetical protein
MGRGIWVIVHGRFRVQGSGSLGSRLRIKDKG